MLKRCPSNDELRGFVDEQLTVEQTRQLETHLQDCARCARSVEHLHALLAAINAPAAAATTGGDSFKRGVLAALDEPEHTSWVLRWRWALTGAMAAAAAAVLVIVLQTTSVGEGSAGGSFQARGAKIDASLAAIAGVDALLRGRALKDNMLLRPGLPLAFRYRNIGKRALYLLAFAIDSANQVHWFYPAYTDASLDPRATQLDSAARDRTLPDVVEPEGCADGTLLVVTVISRRARTVKQVERSLLRDKTAPAIEKLFAGDLVRRWSVRWQQKAQP